MVHLKRIPGNDFQVESQNGKKGECERSEGPREDCWKDGVRRRKVKNKPKGTAVAYFKFIHQGKTSENR